MAGKRDSPRALLQAALGLKAKGGDCGWSHGALALEGELLSLGFLSCTNRRLFPAEEEKELAKEHGQGG